MQSNIIDNLVGCKSGPNYIQ